MGDDFAHDGRKARNGTGAQVIAVTEPAGENHDVGAAQVMLLVPEVHGFLAEDFRHCEERILVGVRSGERDDAELHACSTLAISKSSVTGFASSFAHISRTTRSADCGS